MTDVAKLFNVSVQRVQQLHKAGRLPEPARKDPDSMAGHAGRDAVGDQSPELALLRV